MACNNYNFFSRQFFYYCSIIYFILISSVSFSQCPTPPGDQNTSGTTDWIGYVYGFDITNAAQSPPAGNPFNGTYRGFITQTENFNQDLGSGSLPVNANLCTTSADNFAVRYKFSKTYTAGSYQITVGGDDGYRLYVNSVLNTALNNWSDHAYQTSSDVIVFNGGSVELIFEYYEKSGGSRATFNIIPVCTTNTTAPTSIGGANVCAGGGTTLTANGGNSDTGAFFEWGTGTVGQNVINGQNSSTIIVSPTSNTAYWVRRVDFGRCKVTNAAVRDVIVEPIATAPTMITGNSACTGYNVILRATGGVGSTFQWGEGTVVGTGTISGQTSANYTITNPINGTDYWVRRINASPCSAANTTGIVTRLSLSAPAGDQNTYGENSWIGYIYANQPNGTPANGFSTNYAGFVTQPFTFDQNIENTPLTGPNLCNNSTYINNFAARFKMTRTMPAGTYAITVGADDGFRLSVDGGVNWITNVLRWSTQSYTTETVSVTYANPTNVNFVLEYFQGTGGRRLSFNICSTAPTSITGTNLVCSGSSTTLTATGGVASSTVTYQWGTGTVVGTDPIVGQTGVSLTVSPLVNTTYWVRRMGLGSCAATSGTTQLITVSSPTIAGTASGAQTVCANAAPLGNITLSGSTGNVVRWEKSTDSAFLSPGPTAIPVTSTTLTGAQIGTITLAPTYVRAVVKNGVCPEAFSNNVLLSFESTTWNGTVWSNGDPTLTKSVIINGNFTIPNIGINACSVTVSSTATLTISSNNFLLIQNNLQNNGTINIENNGSLVQISNTAVNTGTINMVRTATAEQFDVIYWSSSVSNQNLSAIPKQSNNTLWQWNPTIPNGNGPNNFGNWEGASGVMTSGRGYAARVPNNTAITPSPITSNFVGTPNNGNISVAVARGSNQSSPSLGTNGTTFTNLDDNLNLIGNPYPSAISVLGFLAANTNLEGAVSIWTHGSSPFTSTATNPFYGSFTYNYSASDYLVHNASGSNNGPGTFNGFIAAGQGFFVKMIDGAATTSTVTFNNSMRGITNRNDQFFRTKNVAAETSKNGRIWLDLIANNRPDVSRILVGYIDGATNENDRLFDASADYQSSQSFYSLIGNSIFGIQGKSIPFDSTDVIALGMGLQTANASGYKIAIAATDGFFDNNGQTIYLEDKLLNIIHNLSIAPYDFTATRGITNNRFVLRYTNATLSLNNQKAAEKSVSVFKDNATIKVVSPAENIASVAIFDILGRELFTKNKVNNSNFESTTLAVSQQTLIVKVVLENGIVVSKKIIF